MSAAARVPEVYLEKLPKSFRGWIPFKIARIRSGQSYGPRSISQVPLHVPGTFFLA